MAIVLKGIVSGILLAFLIGPVFFTIIQTSIEKGFTKGVLVAIGVSLSDAFCIALTYLGLTQLMDNPKFKVYLAYTGGGIFLLFGLYYLFIKSRKMLKFDHDGTVQSKGIFRHIAKGFFINVLSPFVLIFWIGAVGLATTGLGYHTSSKAAIYFGSIVATVFTTDVLKAKLADKLRVLMTPRFIRLLNLVLGIVFIIFGGRLIFVADTFTLP